MSHYAIEEKQILEQVMNTSSALLSGQSLSEILAVILQGVQAVGFDRVRLYLLSEDGRFMVGKAQVGMEVAFEGVQLPLANDSLLQALHEKLELQLFVRQGHRPLPYDEMLDRADVNEWVYIPLAVNRQMVGLLVADDKYSKRPICLETLRPALSVFASQAALAIHNGRLIDKEHQRAEQLEALRQTTLAVTSERERDALLHQIIKHAVNLLEARSGGIKLYYPERQILEVIADYGHPKSIVGHTMQVGEGMAGGLVQSGRPYAIINDYCEWPQRIEEFAQMGWLGSMVAVTLQWQERIIGVLYLDDKVGRQFTKADADLLRLFADQAAIALINADLVSKDTDKLRRLKQLTQASNEIIRDLGQTSLDDRLALIARHAANILNAEACGITLVKQPGVLTLVADYGYRLGLQKGQEFKICSGPGTGLMGHIAYEGQVFNAHGEALTSHFAVKGEVPPQNASGQCHSLLVVPIQHQQDGEARLAGLLRVENKKDTNGRPTAQLYFSDEDEMILQLFAEAVGVVIEAAQLVEQLQEQKAHFSRLIASAPTGIIANSRQGAITYFNDQAQAIMGYTFEEMLGQPVSTVYADSQEAAAIGRHLHESPDDKLRHYETAVVHQDGKHIPIRLTATLLHDAKGENIGTVGYFEDLRAIQESERRLELMLSASDLLAKAGSVAEGLQALARMMVTSWQTSFCRILLLDSRKQYLTVQAAYPLKEFGPGVTWKVGLGRTTAVTEWFHLDELLTHWPYSILRQSGKKGGAILREIATELKLTQPIQSVLIVPLRTRDRVVGLLYMGELRPWEEAPFTEEKCALAIAIAEQTAVLIERFHLYETTKHREQLLRSSYEASNALVSARDPDRIWQDMVEQTRKVAGAEGVRMFLINAAMRQVDIIAKSSDELNVKSNIRPNGLSMQIVHTGQPQMVEDVRKEASRANPSFHERGIMAALGLPVSIEGEVIGVVWVYYNRPRHFSEPETEALQLYVNQAAIAYDNARRLDELERLRQAAQAMAGATSLKKVLRQIVHHAQIVLQADSITVWFYDEGRKKFILENSVSTLPDHIWSEFQKTEPRPGGMTEMVMRLGWAGVQNIINYPYLGKETQKQLHQIGVKSFQGIALKVGEEKLGVLYVNYNRFRHFSEQDWEVARMYANQAALSLQKAKLLDRIQRTQRTVGVVASVTTLANNLEATLNSVLLGTQNALDCDAVVLYIYNQEKERLITPPHMKGVRYPERMQQFSQMRQPSFLSTMLMRDEMYIADYVDQDPLFQDRQFAKDEGIASCVAIPLKVRKKRVGIMFINYRSQHRFIGSELDNMELFANQAAVAIHNAQLYEKQQKQAITLHALQEAAYAVTSSLDLDEILFSIAEQAWKLTGTYGEEAQFSHLALVEGQRLIFKATYPREHLPSLLEIVGPIALNEGKQIGVTGWVVESGEPHLVTDVHSSDYYIQYDSETRSELAVPIKANGKVIGVINVEHPELAAFDNQDIQALETLAEYASIAIHHAQLYERKQKQASALEALNFAAKAVTSSLDLAQILRRIAAQAWHLASYEKRQIRYASIWLAVGPGQIQVAAVYPPDELVYTLEKVGEIIDWGEGQKDPGGIVGRVIRTGEPVLAHDVTQNKDYLASHPNILSELAVPMKVGNEVVGVINVEDDVYAAFDEDDLSALQSLAAQAAIAIKNANLYKTAVRHTRRLHAAAQVASRANTILKEGKLLKEAVRLITDHLGFYHVGVFLLDEKGEDAVLCAASSEEGKRLIARKHKLKVGSEGIVGHVAQSGQPYLTANTQFDTYHLINPSLPQTVMEMAFPLIVRGQVIGVLDVQSNEALVLVDEDKATLQTMANQLAHAIYNARLYGQVQKRASALEALYKAGQAVTSSLDVDTTLATIVEQAAKLTGATGSAAQLCAVALVQDNKNKLNFVATYPSERLSELQKTIEEIDLIQDARLGITGRVAKTGQPLLLSNVHQSDDYIPFDSTIRSSLAVPIKLRKMVRGVITVEHTQYGAFDEEDRRVLVSLAGQAALALQNARTHQEAKILHEVAASLAGVLGFEEVLNLVMQAALALTYTDSGSILFWDEKQERYYPAYTTEGAWKELVAYQASARVKKGYTWQIMQTGQSMIFPDTRLYPDVNPSQLEKGRLCIIGVPLLSKIGTLGVLFVHSSQPRQFSEHQVTMLETLANTATVAIEKAQQYEELKETKGLVGARTALAWMGMASNAWRHNIEGDAVNIRSAVTLLKPQIETAVADNTAQDKIQDKLALIDQLAGQILERPITPPLGEEEGIETIVLNDLIYERMNQLWQDEPYTQVEGPFLEIESTVHMTVLASPEWLRLALDLVVDNAVKAMQETAVRRLTVTTRQVGETVEIAVQDTGVGIDEQVLPTLFGEPLNRPKQDGRLGRGLLMVQAIIHTFGGEINVASTGPDGTMMVLSLPIQNNIS